MRSTSRTSGCPEDAETNERFLRGLDACETVLLKPRFLRGPARMSGATLTIGPKGRGTFHWLMVRRLFILGQDPPALARSEGVSHDQLAKEFGEDLELMGTLAGRSRTIGRRLP
jgi:hypothetical protein